MAVLAVALPEVPVTVTRTGLEVDGAELFAVKVTTLLPAVGFAAKTAVTPLGMPVAARVTLPLNPSTSVTVTVSVAVLPGTTEEMEAEGDSVKPGVIGGVIVSAIVVDAVALPEVPAMVTVTGVEVSGAAPLAVNVTTLEAVAGLAPKVAVSPVGRPETAKFTLPVNPLSSAMVTVSVEELPSGTARLTAEGASAKPAGATGVVALA
jgi:hypothetical protein